MSYYDLSWAKEMCKVPERSLTEMHNENRQVMGYYCCYVPREMLHAAGFVPYRIMGDPKAKMAQVDEHLETVMCPFIRNTFEQALQGQFNGLEGVVFPHSCDSVERLFAIWKEALGPNFSYYLNVPHMIYPTSFEFFEKELRLFHQHMERYQGRNITDKDVVNSVGLYNTNRELIQQLYRLRKQSNPPISGTEMNWVLVAGMRIPVEEHNQMLKHVIKEVQGRKTVPFQGRPRVMLYGSELDNDLFTNLIEECGATVVVEDTCLGLRSFAPYVALNGQDVFNSMAQAYLDKIQCPRTFRHNQDADVRFQYILDAAKDYQVDCVILYVTRFCDTHEFDAPEIESLLEANGIPAIIIEDDYNAASIGQLRTRVQAFLEMII